MKPDRYFVDIADKLRCRRGPDPRCEADGNLESFSKVSPSTCLSCHMALSRLNYVGSILRVGSFTGR
jgi:hypothetical protein